jgi:ABC-type phosphate transport system permease subunit
MSAPALLPAASLVVGFAVADLTDVRPLGGIVLLVAGTACVVLWRRLAGWPTAIGLGVVYAGAFAAAHPLARLVGAWPSVLLVALGTGLAAVLATRSRGDERAAGSRAQARG